ncbi:MULTISPECIES: GGDEF domain-containing protein [Pseudofrankia]|uniref:GGDEF domain-containing protein n=1 Tax=Pseudofrankia TaxID=2994363 RepID=UPI0022B7DCEA|nr:MULTISPECIES: GGDEF domain-containing protein [Pseudofrankia]
MSARAFGWMVACAGVFLVVVLVTALALEPHLGVEVEASAGAVAAGAAAACCGFAGWRCRGAERRWRWLTCGAALLTMVGVSFSVWSTAVSGTNVPRLQLSDLGYMACYALALAGLLTMPTDSLDRGPGGRVGGGHGDRHLEAPSRRWLVPTVLDSLIVVGSLALLYWELVLGDVVLHGGFSLVAVLMAWALALGALVLTVAVFLVGTFRRPRHWPAFGLLAAGLILLALVAVTYAAAAVRRWVLVPSPISTAFVASLLLIGLAAVVPARAPPPPSACDSGESGEGARPSRLQVAHLMLPYLPLCAVGVLALVQLVSWAPVQRGEMFALLFLLTMALLRQVGTLWDNASLLARYRASQRQLRYQAFHDPLTGLANRTLFGERLGDALERRVRGGDPRSLAVLFCDLDDFKIVNDALGHAAGDELLRVTAARLVGAVRAVDTVARLGGDEFAILLEGRDDDPARLGRRVVDAVAAPCLLVGTPYSVRGSVGLAIVESGTLTEPETVLHQADLAMYEAKRVGGTVAVYRPGLSAPEARPIPDAL